MSYSTTFDATGFL